MLRWTGHVARVGEKINTYTNLVGIPEGSRPHIRPKHVWEDDIKTNHISKMGKRGLDSCSLGHAVVAGSCEHGNEPEVR
jgi:hypothetical protein